MATSFISRWRFYLLVIMVVFAFAVVWGRLFQLHILDKDELAAMAVANRKSNITTEARRGEIFDRRGHMLATTRPMIDVGVDPHMFVEDDAPRIADLAALLGLPVDGVETAIRTKLRPAAEDGYLREVRPIRWAKLGEVDETVYDKIMSLRIRGVYGTRHYERFYPAGQMASHLLGFVNKEGAAVQGIERLMDFYLRGQSGWKETEKDGRRRELAQFRDREVPPTDGLSVELTIDLVIQTIIENQIAKIAEEYNPDGITVIVSEPQTGSILGLANYPTYDPNTFWEFPVDFHRNRAITDVLEPGSTFKIVPIAAAIEESLIHPDTMIDCSEPVVEYRGRKVRLPSDHVTLGDIPVTTMVAKSSNRGAAKVGMMLGEQKLYDYAFRFGFGQFTDWGLPGEVRGTLHQVKNWDGLTISRLPAGYAVNATPLQIHFATSVIAARGKLMYPRLISRVVDHQRRTILDFSPRERQRVISPETAAQMADMLVGVVGPTGTARRAAIPGYSIAGKTGTTRKIINGQYTNQQHVASFSGFFPAHNPQLVITVIIDNARMKGVSYGGAVSAPVFREIAEQLIQYLSIQEEPNPRRIAAAH